MSIIKIASLKQEGKELDKELSRYNSQLGRNYVMRSTLAGGGVGLAVSAPIAIPLLKYMKNKKIPLKLIGFKAGLGMGVGYAKGLKSRKEHSKTMALKRDPELRDRLINYDYNRKFKHLKDRENA